MNSHPSAGSQPPARFEDRLLAAILADFENLTDPDSPMTVSPLHHARSPFATRHLVPVVAAAAAALVAAGAVGVTVLNGHPSSPAGGGGSVGPAQPRLLATAYVVAHVKAALNANTAVVITLSHAPNSQTGRPVIFRTWDSSLSGTSRSEILDRQGQPVSGVVMTVTAHKTISVQINYRHRTWTTVTYPFGSAPSGPGPVPAPEPQTATRAAAMLRAEVRSGKMTVVGRGTVDGQRAIELRSGTIRTGQIRLWVSPASYLPIREVDTGPGQTPASPQAIRNDYTWLPGTKANLRLLTKAAAIPPGFTKVTKAR